MNKGLQITTILETYFMKIISSIEPFMEFQRNLNDCIFPYLQCKKNLEKELFFNNDNNKDESLNYSKDNSGQTLIKIRRR